MIFFLFPSPKLLLCHKKTFTAFENFSNNLIFRRRKKRALFQQKRLAKFEFFKILVLVTFW